MLSTFGAYLQRFWAAEEESRAMIGHTPPLHHDINCYFLFPQFIYLFLYYAYLHTAACSSLLFCTFAYPQSLPSKCIHLSLLRLSR